MHNRTVDRFRNDLKQFQRMSYVHGNPLEKLRSLGFSETDIIDCSLGTNPYGCSPKVIEALTGLDWVHIHKYPDPVYRDLIDTLISFWRPLVDLNPSQIMVGAGTSGILEKILKATIVSGTSVFGYAPQFTEFTTEIKAQGGIYESLPLDKEDLHLFDPGAFVDALNPKYSLIYIDNPNNPTGQVISLVSIESILKKAHNLGQIVVVDEAYGDFIDKEKTTLQLVPDYDNLITVRSFSKGSGLANLRVGYAVAQNSLLSYLRKVDLPFPISTSAAYAAQVSLMDDLFVIECREKIKKEKRKLIQACPEFYCAATSDDVPILLLGVEQTHTDLAHDLYLKGILSESGADFHNLGRNYVRLRIPQTTDILIDRLNEYIHI